MKLFGSIILAFVISNNVVAQDSLSKNPILISGYVEAYYSYDFSNPLNHTRPDFFYSYNRHNEVNLNIGVIKAAYSDDKIRGNLAFMTGTYAQHNLASEPALLRNIFEANAGFKLIKKHNLWLDAGILPSHIGFESALGKDCWNLTRSILADNSPYYEAGVKLGYTTLNDKLYLALMYLNGWQRIQKLPGNQTPAFGSQLTYKPKSTLTLNWSTFAGSEGPDSIAQWRYFNNFFAQFQLGSSFAITTGFDIGMQQSSKHSVAYNIWYSPVIILQYQVSDRLKIAARAEYYDDEKGVIISTNTKNGFKTFGYSVNLDYALRKNMLWRIEGRSLNSKDAIFTAGTALSHDNSFISTSLSLSF